MKIDLKQEFSNPPAICRGAPFWAWNGKLDREELRRQIRLMKEMGLGGFFMHSRVGLSTEYLGEEWGECIKACIDEAKQLGMHAWLYDEDRWPSGAAGGHVTKNKEYRQRFLTMYLPESIDGFEMPEKVLGIFAGKFDGEECVSYRKLDSEKSELADGEKLMIFGEEQPGTASWFNNQTYLDLLSKEAVAEFIRVTHEYYKDLCGEEFGKTVPGIFTDEPCYCPNHSPMRDDVRAQISWTTVLPSIYTERHGEDLLERLPEINFDCSEDAPRTRVRYYDCLSHLFATAFVKQIGDWCEENNIMLTGHMLCEDELFSQSRASGSCLRDYEFMQAPGMDLLTQHWRIYDTAKQVSSGAHQFGRKWRLTETYGCTGWDFPFEGHKALGDWQAALGINVRCQHLSWYTMRGEAKRDYPASIFYQSPWWSSYSKVEDYFARINGVICNGEEVRDILVIQPLESVWLMMKQYDPKKHGTELPDEITEYNEKIMIARDWLLKANLDFDYGDEDVISRHASVKGSGEDVRFVIGKAEYKTVLLPNLKTIRSSTIKVLQDFVKAGGKVVFTGELPSRVDASVDSAGENFAGECTCVDFAEDKVVEEVKFTRTVSIVDGKGVETPATLYMLRENEDCYSLFICNTSYEVEDMKPEVCGLEDTVASRKVELPEVSVSLHRDFGDVYELDPESGEIYAVEVKDGKIATSFPRLGSRLFIFAKPGCTPCGFSAAKEYAPVPAPKVETSVSIEQEEFDIVLDEDNVLVLDQPEYSFDGEKWNAPKDIILIDNECRDTCGIEHRGGAFTQPWASKGCEPYSQKVTLRYEFDVEKIPSGALWLGAESLEFCRFFLNGFELCKDMECGWWCDRSLRKVPVQPEYLSLGRNVLSVECDYNQDFPGLEIMYLLGNFGVKVSGSQAAVIAPVSSLKVGDWTSQGLPFYSGSVTYLTEFESTGGNVALSLPDCKAPAVEVFVNGHSSGVTAWPPHVVDISSDVCEGTNRLGIKILGHRRNSHGPLHLTKPHPWVGPGSYRGEDDRTDGYVLVPCGLKEAPVLEKRS